MNREERVAFVGISNWALDPAKMNRGVMVLRDDPKIDELKLSARLTELKPIQLNCIFMTDSLLCTIEEFVQTLKMIQ